MSDAMKCGQCGEEVPAMACVSIKYPTWRQIEKHYRMEVRTVCKLCLPRLKIACEKLLKELMLAGCV